MAQVYLPPSLVALFPGAPRCLAVEAATVADLLRALDSRWPGMWDRLCTTSGSAVREHINIFVDGEKTALHAPLSPSAVVRIIPAVSGG